MLGRGLGGRFFRGKVLFLRLVLLLTIFSSLAEATTKYISDELFIPMRSGSSSEYKVIAYLKSGQKVEELGDAQGEYVRVEAKGKQGWVKSRFLLKEQVASVKLEEAKKDLARMATISDRLQASEARALSLEKERDRLSAQLARVRRVSSSQMATFEENERLAKDLASAKQQLEALNQSYIAMSLNQRNEGIKLGILALTLGALIAYLLPFLKPAGRRNQSALRVR